MTLTPLQQNFEEAIRLLNEEEFEKALSKIYLLEQMAPNFDVILTLKSDALCGLRRYEEAIQTCEQAIVAISSSERLSPEDKKYLKAFTLEMARVAMICVEGSYPHLKQIDMSKIDLFKVDPGLINAFPLETHPGWSIEVYNKILGK